jgi:hypothetical protein
MLVVSIFNKVGRSFQVIPNLGWEMASKLDFGTTHGVRIGPLRMLFQIYLVLLAQKDAFVVALLELSDGSIQWNVSFGRVAED